jgi:SEC-C motif-containing protein
VKIQDLDCPCGRVYDYTDCCGAIIHNKNKEAITAEDLMRSRYASFVKGNGGYLNKSHHSSTRPSTKEGQEIENWAKSVCWIKLEVLDSMNGLLNNKTGTVEFKAYFIENEKVEMIHENSFFEKENGVWMYKGEE